MHDFISVCMEHTYRSRGIYLLSDIAAPTASGAPETGSRENRSAIDAPSDDRPAGSVAAASAAD